MSEEDKATIAKLRAENEELKFYKIRFDVWKQFYGRLLAVPVDADDDTRVKRQAKIIRDMQYKIRNQRNQIKRLLKDDPLVSRNFPRYNVYRHNNKLYSLWQDAVSKVKELGGTL